MDAATGLAQFENTVNMPEVVADETCGERCTNQPPCTGYWVRGKGHPSKQPFSRAALKRKPRKEASTLQLLARPGQTQERQVGCGLGQCRRCSCPAFGGRGNVCEDCGHHYDEHTTSPFRAESRSHNFMEPIMEE